MNVTITSILSVILSTLLLLQVIAGVEISLNQKIINTNGGSVVASYQKVQLSNLPVDVYHPWKSPVMLRFEKEGSKIHIKTDQPSIKYLIIDDKSGKVSELLEIKKGETHTLKRDNDNPLTIMFEE